MSPDDAAAFAALFDRLAYAFREWVDEAKKVAYWEALKGLPLEALQEAAETWQGTGPRFPTTAEWTQSAQAVLARRPPLEEPVPCQECSDTGWVFHECLSGGCGLTSCRTLNERPGGYRHTYVTRCACSR
jgi:hypothetical protein